MTQTLEQHLMDMGVIPAMITQELEAVSDTRHIYPDLLDKNYFNDPRDANGEVPY